MKKDREKLKITPPPAKSAGIHAVTAVVKHVFGKMGPVRGTRGLLKLNQKGGIDCQSCAWPDPEHRTINEFCENGAKALADEGMKATIGRDFFAANSVADLANESEYWLNRQGRLTEPVILREGGTHYEPITWDDAFELIAGELRSLESPDEAIFYTSGRTSNEAAFLYQLFVRMFGTNNLPDCSNMCHESTSVALAESIGLGKATIRLEDFTKTDLVIVVGQNPGTNAPRMLSSLRAAKLAGAKMISINPLPEVGLINFVDPNPQHYRDPVSGPFSLLTNHGTPLADLHMPVKIGGDMAVIKGLMKVVLEREREKPGTILDREFIDAKTSGYDSFIESLDSVSWDDIVTMSGLTREAIGEAADMILAAGSYITCWAMGVTQHTDAVATIQDIVNLHLLRGAIGRPGAGLCPVRGHSNVQGDRTMGIWEKMTPVFRENLEREFSFHAPAANGFNTVEGIAAMLDGRAKVFFAMGGNFVAATPDSQRVADALANCRLTVQVITKLNRTALTPGKVSLILPCLGRSEIDRQSGGEQFVSTESTMLNVQMSRGIFEPLSEHLRSETWIICRLAKAVLGTDSAVDWDALAADYDLIRESISRVVPGTEDYNRRIREPGGFYMPNPPNNRDFPTAEGKALFRSHPLEVRVPASGRLMLTTIRSHDQFNTTIYSLDDRYRGVAGGREVLFMNTLDIERYGLAEGGPADITSYFDDGERYLKGFTVVPYSIPEGCVAAYFPEANPLIPLSSTARRSGTPTSKCVIVSVTASN